MTILKRLATIFILLSSVTAARSGPPLLTDDPDTPGPNHWEINLAFLSERDPNQWQFQTPLLDMNYGVGDTIQLKYQVPWMDVEPDHEGLRSGLGQSLIGVKWRFYEQTNSGFEISTYPQYGCLQPGSSVPRGLSDDGWSMLLPIEIERKMGPFVAYTELGYFWNQRQSDRFLYGLAGEWDITEKFALMGELNGTAQEQFKDHNLVFNLGLTWKFSEHVALLMSAGRSIATPAGPDFMSYLALQFTY